MCRDRGSARRILLLSTLFTVRPLGWAPSARLQEQPSGGTQSGSAPPRRRVFKEAEQTVLRFRRVRTNAFITARWPHPRPRDVNLSVPINLHIRGPIMSAGNVAGRSARTASLRKFAYALFAPLRGRRVALAVGGAAVMMVGTL